MKRSSEENADSDMHERGLIAHILRRCCDDSGNNNDFGRKIVGIIATIVQRESFQDPDLGRIWAAVKLWSADESSSCLAAELYEMFKYVGDQQAARALIDLTASPSHISSKQPGFPLSGDSDPAFESTLLSVPILHRLKAGALAHALPRR